jgi:hypothetical protein
MTCNNMKVKSLLILCLLLFLTTACHEGSTKASRNERLAEAAGEVSNAYKSPVHLGNLEDNALDESSGIVASRRNPDLFWTHNDSGDGPFLYAFDRTGAKRGTWRVMGADALDWEDIAAGPGPQPGQPYLYVGDIGDNGRERREIVVYRVAEPVVTPDDAGTNRIEPQQTEPAEAIRLRYPDGRYDAEALVVHPTTGDLYVITKTRGTTVAASVYKLAAPFSTSAVNTLEKVGELRVPSILPGMITGGDISPDGTKLILCDYFNAYEMSLPEKSRGKFDDIWKQSPAIVKLGEREQGEAVCYRLDGRAILAISEGRHSDLIEAERIKP